ncbi:MAG: cysteine--tRNA ligase [Candidatus Aenigmarchaeota archaeon]|nr:cysteine--tRNA ligase [Candidatus Aenigmarchaeota archaeon]
MFHVFDSLKRKKVIFKPLRDHAVSLYTCGPTVYDFAHIGNFRTYLVEDLLRRYLEHKGFTVHHVMNITDVGHMTSDADEGQDKIEKAASREKKTVWDIADFYTQAFLADSKTMKLKEPEQRPKAMAHVPEMIALIQKLIENKHAYVANNSVYYDISTFKKYGKLSGNSLKQLSAGAGGRVGENADKKHPLDFALWIHNPAHVMQWDSPWGRGYPGWHVECSAMAQKYLGETIDIHMGGVDNKFPHHESEIAQSEGANKKPFVRYWLHTAHLLVNGEKMAKSTGNFYTVRDILAKGYMPETLRFALLSAHYRAHLNFSWDSMDHAQKTIDGLNEVVRKLQETKNGVAYNKKLGMATTKAQRAFERALDDDLNVSLALKAVFGVVHQVNQSLERKEFSEKNRKEILDFLHMVDRIFDVLQWQETDVITPEQQQFIDDRQRARTQGDFATADRIRAALLKDGILLEDTPSGMRWKKIRR